MERALGTEHPGVATSLAALAGALRSSGEHLAAVRVLERAVEIHGCDAGVLDEELRARFALADALARSGGDRARAQRLAAQACAGWRERDPSSDEIEDIDAWLVEHGATGCSRTPSP